MFLKLLSLLICSSAEFAEQFHDGLLTIIKLVHADYLMLKHCLPGLWSYGSFSTIHGFMERSSISMIKAWSYKTFSRSSSHSIVSRSWKMILPFTLQLLNVSFCAINACKSAEVVGIALNNLFNWLMEQTPTEEFLRQFIWKIQLSEA